MQIIIGGGGQIPSRSSQKLLGEHLGRAGAYDAYGTRRLLIRKLKAIPFIALNPRNCKGNTPEEKMERCRKLRYKWHSKNFLKEWWTDPDSETFDKEYDARTFSEQEFFVGSGLMLEMEGR